MSYTLTLHHRLVRMAACWLLFQFGSYSIIFLQNWSHYTYISRPPTRCRIVDPSFSPCCFSRPQVLYLTFRWMVCCTPKIRILHLAIFHFTAMLLNTQKNPRFILSCGRQSKVWEILLPPLIIFSEGFKMTGTWTKHCGLALKSNFHWWDSYVFQP